MIPFDEALALIERRVEPLASEVVPLAQSAGRYLAADLRARSDSPRHAVSAMDGYAVIDAATRPDMSLEVVGESRAGAGFDGKVAPGQTVRIFTGARLPDGADRVVVQEHAKREGDFVRFTEGYGPASHIRPAGMDFRADDVLLAAGMRLDPRALVTASAADRSDVTVSRSPRVVVLGTGDELAPPGSAHLSRDAIPESVTLGVAAMVEAQGGSVVSRGSMSDDIDALTDWAEGALQVADLVVVVGGASVGERDFARPMFERHGLELIFSRVAIKPGKPVWLGLSGGAVVLGLPGNPTSAMVTASLFLKPLLARLQGASARLRWRTLPLASQIPATGDRETFVRARWDDAGLVPLGNQDSGAQGPLAFADWLIRCPTGQRALSAGTAVSALAF